MKRKKIKSVWKEYLTLSMRERRGLSILLSILLFQLVFLFYLNHIDLNYPFPELATVQKLKAEMEISENVKTSNEKFNTAAFDHSVFNPNDLTKEEWVKIGLSERQAGSVLNYLKKGGRFKTKKDVLKIYGMNDKLYSQLLPYIDLPDSFSRNSFTFEKKNQKVVSKVDVNTADSVSLEKLRGIGSVLASRIVRYRERLGGFVSLEQLKEVYGLNDTLFRLIEPQVFLTSPPDIRFVKLNSDSFPTLSSHPYIGRKLAGMILNYRKQHERFNNTDELKNLPLLTDEIFRKLAPYLKVD